MSDKTSGPVKPPVLDATAKGEKSETDTTETTGAEAHLDDSVVEDDPAHHEATTHHADNTDRSDGTALAGAVGIGVVGGGILGLAAAYALAWAGMWPTPANNGGASSAIEANAEAISGVESRLEELVGQIGPLAERIDAQDQALAGLEDGGGAPDLSGIEEQIATLQSRLESVEAAGDDGGDVSAEAQGAINTLTDQVTTLETRLGEQQATLDSLGAALDEPSDMSAAVRLPLILSSLEAAFATGRPFADELDALRQAAPDMTIPEALDAAADEGLERRDEVLGAFRDVMPDMLGRQPVAEDAGWQERTGAWMRSVLAIRPSGEVEGETPDAVMSQIEAALERGDFETANERLTSLPEDMLAAAGDVPELIARHAAADAVLADTRTQALDVADEVQS